MPPYFSHILLCATEAHKMPTTLENLVHSARAMHTTHRMNQTYLSELTFENLVEYFEDPQVIWSTNACLEACVDSCYEWKVYEGPKVEIEFHFVLAGYMLVMHPNSAFQASTDKANELVHSATRFINQFEGILDILVFAGPISNKREFFLTLAKDFCENLADFHTKYLAWKREDEAAFAMRTYKTMVSLFKAMLLTNGEGRLDTKDPRIVDIMDTIAWLRTSFNELRYHYLVDSYDIMSRQILEDQ